MGLPQRAGWCPAEGAGERVWGDAGSGIARRAVKCCCLSGREGGTGATAVSGHAQLSQVSLRSACRTGSPHWHRATPILTCSLLSAPPYTASLCGAVGPMPLTICSLHKAVRGSQDLQLLQRQDRCAGQQLAGRGATTGRAGSLASAMPRSVPVSPAGRVCAAVWPFGAPLRCGRCRVACSLPFASLCV